MKRALWWMFAAGVILMVLAAGVFAFGALVAMSPRPVPLGVRVLGLGLATLVGLFFLRAL